MLLLFFFFIFKNRIIWTFISSTQRNKNRLHSNVNEILNGKAWMKKLLKTQNWDKYSFYGTWNGQTITKKTWTKNGVTFGSFQQPPGNCFYHHETNCAIGVCCFFSLFLSIYTYKERTLGRSDFIHNRKRMNDFMAIWARKLRHFNETKRNTVDTILVFFLFR